jgi:hypothetical protein
MMRSLLDAYAAGTDAILSALQGADEAALDRRPAAVGAWTAREVVHHLGDAETRSAVRLRQLLAEDAPVIVGYDEDRYTQRLRYDRPLGASLDIVAAVRRGNAELLATVTDEDLARAGFHTDSGPYTLTDWLRIYTAHATDHAEQIRRALRGEA